MIGSNCRGFKILKVFVAVMTGLVTVVGVAMVVLSASREEGVVVMGVRALCMSAMGLPSTGATGATAGMVNPITAPSCCTGDLAVCSFSVLRHLALRFWNHT